MTYQIISYSHNYILHVTKQHEQHNNTKILLLQNVVLSIFSNNLYQTKINENRKKVIFLYFYILKRAKFVECAVIILEICVYMYRKPFFCVIPAKQMV